MFTYTSGRNLFGQFTNNSDATNLTLGDILINQAIKELIDYRSWFFKEGTADITTVADQQAYQLPNDLDKVTTVNVTVSTVEYQPTKISTKKEWDYINTTTCTSDIPTYYFVFDGQIEIYPIPSAGASTMTVTYQKTQRDLTMADYTTGTITTATNGDESIVGNGTTWTAQMAGMFMKITGTSTANTGDNKWYKIASIGSATTIELTKKYQGNSIVGGTAAYTIGESSIIPEEYQILPIYKACETYFVTIQPEIGRAQYFGKLYEEGLNRMISGARKSDDPQINIYDGELVNPNNYVRL